MVKRLAWLCLTLLLMPAVARADEKEGVYFPPQSPRAVDLDTAPNDLLNRNVRILRTTNKAQLNRYVPKVYSLRNVNPFQILRYIRRAVQAEEGAIFTFVSPDGNGGRVLIAVPEYQLESIDDLVRTLDKPSLTSDDGTRRIYRQLKHRRANVAGDTTLTDTDFINQFNTYLTTNGSVVAVDPGTNAVYIEDAPSGADYLDIAITDKLDVPTPQVVLSTKIYELDMTNARRLGLDYIAWKNGPGAHLFTFGAFGERGRNSIRNGSIANVGNDNGLLDIPAEGNITPLSPNRGHFDSDGYNFAWRYEFNSAYFDYLSVKGKGKILNEARVAVLNTRTAGVTAGDQVLFYQVQTSDPSGVRPPGQPFAANNGRSLTVNNPSSFEQTTDHDIDQLVPSFNLSEEDNFINTALDYSSHLLFSADTGIKICLSPLIYENGVDVNITGRVKDFVGFDSLGSPRINTRSFSTAVRMSEGEEIVLGGLTREAEIKNSPKIPVLGSLPVIGWLAGGENTSVQKKQVVMVLKADDIVRYDGKDYGITDADKALIAQGEGTEPIQTPKTTWGFDMSLIDKSKESYTRILDHYME